MPAIQIRDVPEHIYRLLAETAGRHRRSLAQQALESLAKGLEVESDAKARRRRILKAIAASKPGSHQLQDPVALVREDRGR